MAVIKYEGVNVPNEQGESVLESLEKAGFRIPYSCRSGVCQSCMLQTSDTISIDSQKGLREQQVMQGYFLSCCCYPENDISVTAKACSDHAMGLVVDKKILNAQSKIFAVFIEVDFTWFAGQYINIYLDEYTSRPYSIASRCDDRKVLELHIKEHELGEVSRWLNSGLGIGDTVKLSLPIGDCFYTNSYQDSPLLLVATGTGLAPLYGVLQEALYSNHTKAIHLYTAASEPSGLYYQHELQNITSQFENVHVHAVAKQNAQAGQLEGDVVSIVKQRHSEMKGHKIFLCGSPTMVKALQRACFFQGATISDILVDAFEIAVKKIDK
jgi:CDP-4-dehydro-6-deoxyglucose reductase, E3